MSPPGRTTAGAAAYRIDVRGVTVMRGRSEVLSNVSLSAKSGELIALLGPSGSGKSTLLRAMIGGRASAGKVEVSGRDLRREFESMKTRIGYVPQDDILHTSLTVEKTLRYAAELRLPGAPAPVRKVAIERALGAVELKERRGVRVRSLSGGQRKRVSIAVELLAEPPLFFLDEPTSGLDPALEEKMMRLFRELTNERRVTVVTTHVLASLELVDLALIVAGGRLVFVGPPKEAPAFFGVGDLPSIYRTVASTPAREWARKFEATSLYGTYVRERLSTPPPPFPSERSAAVEAELEKRKGEVRER